MSERSPEQATKIQEGRAILEELNFDAERSNERSALVLLALADVGPTTPWTDATNPLRRTTEIMNWIDQHYRVRYAPNTRETVRRQTLHQFVGAGLVVQNPDDPARPINSPRWCYQLTGEALEVLRAIGNPRRDAAVADYLNKLPGLLAQYQAARDLQKIPVALQTAPPSPSALAGRTTCCGRWFTSSARGSRPMGRSSTSVTPPGSLSASTTRTSLLSSA